MAFSPDIAEIKSRVDIVSLINRHTSLKKFGSIWKGKCPFHAEKTPSFIVSPERGTYHCFGCGEHGDIFTFIQKVEGLDFRGALEKLAAETGVVLHRSPSEKQKLTEKESLLHAQEFASQWFVENLHKGENLGKEYALKRGLTFETLARFGVGYAPPEWTGLVSAAQKKGISLDRLRTLGLISLSAKNQQYYDRFRNRLMIPLRDTSGHVIAFTGRWLGSADAEEAKYVNSPEHLLFHKGSFVFGTDVAKIAMRRSGIAVVVEGNIDVMSAHQAGAENVVCISGTACTENHIKLLQKYATKIVLCFDHDDAGINATMRAIPLFWASGVELFIASWWGNEAKDPDELIRKDKDKFLHSIENPQPVMAWVFEILQRHCSMVDPIGKQQFIQRSIRILRVCPSPVEVDYWLSELARITRINRSAVLAEFQQQNVATSSHSLKDSFIKKSDPWEKLLALAIIHSPIAEKLNEVWPELLVDAPPHAVTLYEEMQKRYSGNENSSFIEKEASSTTESAYERAWLWGQALISEMTHGETTALTEASLILNRLLRARYSAEVSRLADALRHAEREGRDDEKQRIMSAIKNLQTRIAQLH